MPMGIRRFDKRLEVELDVDLGAPSFLRGRDGVGEPLTQLADPGLPQVEGY